ncbi:MAG: antitoxin [Streptosporangiales bacterium]
MANQDWRQQGKQLADALREGFDDIRGDITEQTARHEDTIKDKIDRAAGYIDGKTDSKYADRLDKARERLTERVERIADEGRGRDGE